MIRVRLDRSAARPSGESMSSWIMVGTSRASVTRCSSIAAATPAGVNDGTMTWVARVRHPIVHAARSARWNMGAACRSTPPRLSMPVVTSEPIADVRHARWESITPFGVPVVPPV